MSIELLTLILFIGLFGVLFTGLPVAFTLGGVSLVFTYFYWGPQALYTVVSNTWGAMNEFVFVAVPLFIFMAMILERAGLAEALYDAMFMWFGPVRGGLAIGTLCICAIFAAMSGITGTAVVTMGTIALPSMMKRGYSHTLALGAINSGGGWGILIPPSTDMVIYALIAGESVGKMFAGGIFPGLLLLVLDSIYILIRAYFQPTLAPALPKEERGDWKAKLKAGKALILPFAVIFLVLGTILMGVATPTEGAAMGVLGSVLSAVVNRRISWTLIRQASERALSISVMVIWIIFGAFCFSSLFQGMGAPQVIINLMEHVPGGRWGALIFFQLVIFVMACVVNPTTIMMVCIPCFLPVVKAFGMDTLWFAIVFIVNLQIGYMTPPFGYNLFYLRALSPPGITMGDIYRSVIFFVMVELGGLALVMVFPEIAIWLPNKLFSGR